MSESRLRRVRDGSGGPATLINDGCKISGLVTGDGDIHVSGEIDGDCDLEGTVTLAKNGFWSGTIKAATWIGRLRVRPAIAAARISGVGR